MTRIVLDVSAKANFHADLDNDEHLLVIELPDSGWDAAKAAPSLDSPLVKSWNVEAMDGGKGSRLILQLKGPARIAGQVTMPGSPFKVVIDLAAVK